MKANKTCGVVWAAAHTHPHGSSPQLASSLYSHTHMWTSQMLRSCCYIVNGNKLFKAASCWELISKFGSGKMNKSFLFYCLNKWKYCSGYLSSISAYRKKVPFGNFSSVIPNTAVSAYFKVNPSIKSSKSIKSSINSNNVRLPFHSKDQISIPSSVLFRRPSTSDLARHFISLLINGCRSINI